MRVRLTKTLNAKRNLVEGAEFDWPRRMIASLRAEHGDDVVVPTGQTAQAIARMQSRVKSRGADKPSRQERLMVKEPQIETSRRRRVRASEEVLSQ